MNYIPIPTMLQALQTAGMSDAQIGRLVGINRSNVYRLRSGKSRDTAASTYFALYALWQEQAQVQKETKQHDRS
jgi:predicted XRE-type DNA-binding protein